MKEAPAGEMTFVFLRENRDTLKLLLPTGFSHGKEDLSEKNKTL